jgi:hypothetical protein
MNLENTGTNSFACTVIMPDGGTVGVVLQGGHVLSCAGVVVGGVDYQDNLETNYTGIITDTGGLTLAANPSASGVYVSGLWDFAPLAAVLACVWLIRRSLGDTTKGYSTE